MIPYGKSAQYAVAAMSRLAEAYGTNTLLNAVDLARSRDLPAPVVAKVLTTLSQAGLIVGSRGPNGGYALARPPADITLYDVAVLFERRQDALTCPFGPNWCGRGAPCPLHHQLVELQDRMERFLRDNSLASFAVLRQQKPPTTTGAATDDRPPHGSRPARKRAQ